MTTPTADIVGTFYRAFSGETDLFDRVLAEDWDDIPLAPGQAAGRAGGKDLVTGVNAVFRDFEIVVHEVVDGRGPDGEGMVAARAEMRGVQEGDWFGIPGTGQAFSVPIHEFHQISGDRITRTWHMEDWHGWLQRASAETGSGPAVATTMSVLRVDGYGQAPELVEVPTPSPGPGEVLVRVAAAALNPLDLKMVAGSMHGFFPVEFPYTVGTDLSGTIAAVGPDVASWSPGDAVVARTHPSAGGAVAEYALVPADQLVTPPTSLPLTVAAGIGTAAATAWQALHEVARVQPGQTVLVHAGAGAVGSAVVQLAVRAGARVITTASPSGAETAARLGAHQVVDYTTTDFRTAVADVDLVVDTVGGDVETASLDVLRPGGLLVALPVPPDTDRASARGLRAEFVVHMSDPARLATVVREVDAGLEVLVDRIVPLGDATEALDVLAAGHAKGKIIIEAGAR